jgi:hypothetical protein
MDIVSEPVIVALQVVEELVASTVYVPAVVNSPKSIAELEPATEAPTGVLPSYNW